MSDTPQYLCYGHRLLKSNDFSTSTGSFLLRNDKESHWVQIVEDINQVSSINNNTHRFAVIYEHHQNSKKSNHLFKNLTKKKAEAKIKKFFKNDNIFLLIQTGFPLFFFQY